MKSSPQHVDSHKCACNIRKSWFRLSHLHPEGGVIVTQGLAEWKMLLVNFPYGIMGTGFFFPLMPFWEEAHFLFTAWSGYLFLRLRSNLVLKFLHSLACVVGSPWFQATPSPCSHPWCVFNCPSPACFWCPLLWVCWAVASERLSGLG